MLSASIETRYRRSKCPCLFWHWSASYKLHCYWPAILLAALLFGLGHLPATKAIMPLTPLIVARALLLNGIAGIAFGWLYWQYGLVGAMLAHFCADIVLHLIGPLFASHHDNSARTSEAVPASN